MFARRHRRDWRQGARHAIWPRRGWMRRFAYYRKRVLRLAASPHAVAAGVSMGAFASFTPFIGLHILLALALAFAIRGNLVAAALGTAIGNPLTFPLIWASTYEVGRWVMSGGSDPVAGTAEAAAAGTGVLAEGLFAAGFDRIWPVLEPMLVGSVPLGAVAAVLTYALVYPAVRGVQRRRRERLARREAVTAPVLERELAS